MQNSSVVKVQNLLILLFTVLAGVAFIEEDPGKFLLLGIAAWLLVLALLEKQTDRVRLNRNFRLMGIFYALTALIGTIFPVTLAGIFVGGWLTGLLSGAVILLLNLAVYFYINRFLSSTKNKGKI